MERESKSLSLNDRLDKIREFHETPEGKADLERSVKKFIAKEERNESRAIRFWTSKRADHIRKRVRQGLANESEIVSTDFDNVDVAPGIKGEEFDELMGNAFVWARKTIPSKIYYDEKYDFGNENFVHDGLKYTVIIGQGCIYKVALAENGKLEEKSLPGTDEKHISFFVPEEKTSEEFLLNRGFREIGYGEYLNGHNKVCLKPDGIYCYTHSAEHGDYLEMHLNFIPENYLLAHLLKKIHFT